MAGRNSQLSGSRITNSTLEPSQLFGFHATSIRGLESVVDEHLAMGCRTAQVFLGNNKSYSIPNVADQPELRKKIKETDFHLIVHSPYILNFAHPLSRNENGYQKPLYRYLADLKNADRVGAVGCVLHMGSNVSKLNQSTEESYRTFNENLRWIIERKRAESIKALVILENMAGQGTTMACRLDQWSTFWNDFVDDDLKSDIVWCIDTAHLFGAGEFDLSRVSEVKRFFHEFNEKIGWRWVKLIHLNDSKVPCGSCKDRHADIGSGHIGERGIRQFARYAAKYKLPMILEIPGDTRSPLDQCIQMHYWLFSSSQK